MTCECNIGSGRLSQIASSDIPALENHQEHLLHAKKRSVSVPRPRSQHSKRPKRLSAPSSQAKHQAGLNSDQNKEWHSMQSDLLMIIVGKVAPQTASIMRLVGLFHHALPTSAAVPSPRQDYSSLFVLKLVQASLNECRSFPIISVHVNDVLSGKNII